MKNGREISPKYTGLYHESDEIFILDMLDRLDAGLTSLEDPITGLPYHKTENGRFSVQTTPTNISEAIYHHIFSYCFGDRPKAVQQLKKLLFYIHKIPKV